MEDNSAGSSISLCSALTTSFVVLKLCKVIKWSWWLVFLPTWLPIALVAVVLLGLYIMEKIFIDIF